MPPGNGSAAGGAPPWTMFAHGLFLELFPLARAVEVRGDRRVDECNEERGDREKERGRRGRSGRQIAAAQERRCAVQKERDDRGVSSSSARLARSPSARITVTVHASQYETTTNPFVSFEPQANQAMKSVRESAIPSPIATNAMVARGENPKRRPWKSSFTGSAMLAARRTLRLGGHSAARLAVVAAAAATQRYAKAEIARGHRDTPRKRDLAPTKVPQEDRQRTASATAHVRTIAR